LKRIYVKSSVIKYFGYDPDTKILEVQIITGETYHYYNVQLQMFEELKTAPSKGKYYNEVIKKAGFDYKKIN